VELARPSQRLAAVPTTRRASTRIGRFALGVSLVASLAACSSGPGASPSLSTVDVQGLAGRTFLSVAVTDGGADHQLVNGTRIRLDVRDADFSASAGCNTIGGRYRIEAGRLVVDQLATTDMGCPGALGAQDEWLARFLGAGPTIHLDGNALDLSTGSIVIRLMDRRIVDPDRALVGPTWTLESIISGDVVSSVPSDATAATLIFGADGTLTVFTGCNQGGAKWSQAGSRLVVTELVLTKQACAGSGAQLEAAVTGVLRAATIDLRIVADSLTLQAGATGIQLRGR
jgi:heat shock protein HslJ